MERNPNILIVDDIFDNLTLLEDILEIFEVNIIMAQSGHEAIEKIRNKEIALALIDIRMPGMSGVELADILQNDKTHDTFPIIFITAQANDEFELEKCYSSGAVDFILKPFNKRILTSKIKVFIELFRQKQNILDQRLELEESSREMANLNQKLLQSNQFNTSLLQTIPFGMAIISEERTILFMNENLEKDFGKDVLGKKCWEVYHDEKVQCNDCQLNPEIQIGETNSFEIHGVMGGRIAEVSYTGMMFNGKKAILKIFQDITARKKTEEALRISETLYHNLFENMLDGFAWCKMLFDDENKPYDFTYLAVNKAFEAQTGLKDVVGKNVSEIIPGIRESDPELFELYGTVAQGGPPRNFEFYLQSLKMWLSISVYSPQIGYFVAIFEVITQRKLIENALKESEVNYHTFFDTMGDMILVANQSGRIIFTNKALKHKLGYTAEELSEMYAIDLNPADARPEASEIFEAMFRGDREMCPLPLETKSGELIPAESRLWFGRWNGADCIFGISKDVSAELEAKLRFESIFRHSPTPMALSVFPEQTFTDVNNAFLRTLDYSFEEIIGKTTHELGLFPKQEEQEAASKQLLSSGRITNIELQVNGKNGKIIQGLFSGELMSINGKKYLLTAMIDITRRKQAEEALIESEKKYRQLVELAQEGIWTINTESITTYVNPRMAEILGYFVEEMMGKSLYSFMDEKGIEIAQKNVERRKQGIREQHEFEFIRKDGKRIYTSIETTPINGDTGNYLGALALVADITERKVAEDNLKESEEAAHALINAILESAFLMNTDGTVLAHNEIVEKRLGLNKGELLGTCVFDYLSPDIRESRKVKMEEVIHSGKPVRFEDERTGRNMDNSIYPILDGEGNVTRLAVFGNDISELKINEQKIIENEKMLTSIIENLPLMLFVKSAKDLCFVRFNKAGEELLGYTRDEMIGKSDYDFFPKAEAEFFILNDLEVLETKAPKEIPEEKIQTKHQGERFLYTKKIPILDSEGNAEFLLGISEDITVKKQNKDALIESEKMYRTLLNASPEGIIIMDINGLITEISNITLEIFGAENKYEFIGEHFFHLIPDEEIGKLKDVLTKTQVEGLVQNVEVILTKKNKTQFICELSTTLIQETDGRPKAYMAIIRDISQRKKIEQQLIRTERMVSLGEMASGMAHEINQPLLSITLGIENMFFKIKQTNAVDENYFKIKSEKIFEDIQRIGYIIDHVRAFSRDHDDYIVTSFNINESIKNAISMISEQFKHHGIKLTIKLDKKVHPINGNTYKFEQVILNLLNNAKDALEEKTKVTKDDFEKSIKIKTSFDEQTNYVEVTDNGIGIKSEDIDRILFPFYTTKDVGKGTGLGLSISFGIIKELNGNIEIESKSMDGTTFRITLPKTEPHDRTKEQ